MSAKGAIKRASRGKKGDKIEQECERMLKCSLASEKTAKKLKGKRSNRKPLIEHAHKRRMVAKAVKRTVLKALGEQRDAFGFSDEKLSRMSVRFADEVLRARL